MWEGMTTAYMCLPSRQLPSDPDVSVGLVEKPSALPFCDLPFQCTLLRKPYHIGQHFSKQTPPLAQLLGVGTVRSSHKCMHISKCSIQKRQQLQVKYFFKTTQDISLFIIPYEGHSRRIGLSFVVDHAEKLTKIF